MAATTLSVREFKAQLEVEVGYDLADSLITAAVGIVRGYEHWPWYRYQYLTIASYEGLVAQVIAVVGEILMELEAGASCEEAERTAMKRVLQELRTAYSAERKPQMRGLENSYGIPRAVAPSAEEEYFAQHSEAAPAEVVVAELYRMATPAQREIMDALGAGLRPAEVRDLLGLKYSTYVGQRMRALRKKAEQKGVVPPSAA